MRRNLQERCASVPRSGQRPLSFRTCTVRMSRCNERVGLEHVAALLISLDENIRPCGEADRCQCLKATSRSDQLRDIWLRLRAKCTDPSCRNERWMAAPAM